MYFLMQRTNVLNTQNLNEENKNLLKVDEMKGKSCFISFLRHCIERDLNLK